MTPHTSHILTPRQRSDMFYSIDDEEWVFQNCKISRPRERDSCAMT